MDIPLDVLFSVKSSEDCKGFEKVKKIPPADVSQTVSLEMVIFKIPEIIELLLERAAGFEPVTFSLGS